MATRDRILDAAAQVMRTAGLARATTREIAAVAGLSEAALYKHFRDKEDLILAVVHERLPAFVPLLHDLPARVGQEAVEATLTAVAHAALAYYAELVPMLAGLFAEPRLLAGHRDGLRARGVGPHLAVPAVAAYLRAEQVLGRVAAAADPAAAAALLLGACFQRAFLLHVVGEDVLGPAPAFPDDLAATLLRGLAPSAGSPAP